MPQPSAAASTASETGQPKIAELMLTAQALNKHCTELLHRHPCPQHQQLSSNQDGQKRAGFEISRNQIGSRGRSHGTQGPSQPRRNIQ